MSRVGQTPESSLKTGHDKLLFGLGARLMSLAVLVTTNANEEMGICVFHIYNEGYGCLPIRLVPVKKEKRKITDRDPLQTHPLIIKGQLGRERKRDEKKKKRPFWCSC